MTPVDTTKEKGAYELQINRTVRHSAYKSQRFIRFEKRFMTAYENVRKRNIDLTDARTQVNGFEEIVIVEGRMKMAQMNI